MSTRNGRDNMKAKKQKKEPLEMQYYFAPMEGITGYIYRNVHHRFFPGMDKYFSPFLSPGPKKTMTPKELRDILPENNRGYNLIPQILTNRSEDFLRLCRDLKEYGYKEVNLNLGCPSGTVVSKKKGAGFLEYPHELDRFLEEIFSGTELEISIKTRIGMEDPEEFEELLSIYNKYPLKELIIHPRVRTDYYKNSPNLKAFAMALEKTRIPVCYNGDLFSKELCKEFFKRFPQVERIMLGRGLLKNPALVQEIRGEGKLDREKFLAFHDALCREYEKVMSGDQNVLFKMKELWFYMGSLFEENKKAMKRIKKAQRLPEYQAAVREMSHLWKEE